MPYFLTVRNVGPSKYEVDLHEYTLKKVEDVRDLIRLLSVCCDFMVPKIDKGCS